MPVLVYFKRRKILWCAPFFATAVGVLFTWAVYPDLLTGMINMSDAGTGILWLIIAVPWLFIVSVLACVILKIIDAVSKTDRRGLK